MEESRVIGVIAEQLGISESEITSETTFEYLGADSLDLFQIVSALEEEFEIEFDNDAAESIKTVGDAVAYISKALED